MGADAWDRAYLWRFRAKPLRVIDGDGILVLADTGFHGRHEVNIRIADLNAPELHTQEGHDAKMRLEEAIGWQSGWPLRVVTRQRETVVSEVRSFERFVADVFLIGAGGDLVNVREVL